MNTQKQIEYWIKASELDWITANDIFNSGKNFHLCLFMCHLTLEKILKALVIKITGSFPPKTHNLLRLAELSNLDLTDDKIHFFEELNQFQLETRYPDDKLSIYKIATKDFTFEKINKVRDAREWLMSKI